MFIKILGNAGLGAKLFGAEVAGLSLIDRENKGFSRFIYNFLLTDASFVTTLA
jgi:hypothetical protein